MFGCNLLTSLVTRKSCFDSLSGVPSILRRHFILTALFYGSVSMHSFKFSAYSYHIFNRSWNICSYFVPVISITLCSVILCHAAAVRREFSTTFILCNYSFANAQCSHLYRNVPKPISTHFVFGIFRLILTCVPLKYCFHTACQPCFNIPNQSWQPYNK